MFEGYKSGFEFEEGLVDYLRSSRFEANRTGKSDCGIDIVAVSNTVPKYTFNIQCKYQNAPLGKRAVQEVYTGTAYYGNGGKPVVVTNNMYPFLLKLCHFSSIIFLVFHVFALNSRYR